MPNYTFTFKKDDVFVEFLTTERDVVEKQFEIWVQDADRYVAALAGKTPREKTRIQDEKQDCEPVKEKTETVQPAPQPKVEQPVAEKIEPAPAAEIIKPEPVAIDTSKTINSIQNPQPVVEPAQEVVNFDDVLEKSIENPTFEPNKVKDQVFVNFVNAKQTNDKFHYLIITAYYLSEFEKLERFSLKQINAKLVQNFSEVIDHTTLQEAIGQGLIELIPDLTGVSETAEYKLTPAGEDFFANKI